METIKDFLISATEEAIQEETKNIPKKKRVVEYTTVFASGPDFGIRRKTKTTSSVFVCIMTAGQIYIKDEKTGYIHKPLKPNDLAKFFSDLDEEYVFDKELAPNFINKIEKGKEFSEALLQLANNEVVVNLAKHGYLKFKQMPLPQYRRNNYTEHSVENEIGMNGFRTFSGQLIEIAKVVEKIYDRKTAQKLITSVLDETRLNGALYGLSRFANERDTKCIIKMQDDRLIANISSFQLLETIYGLDGVRKYIEAVLLSPAQVTPTLDDFVSVMCEEEAEYELRAYRTRPRAHLRNFDLDGFIEYSVYESYAHGFRSDYDVHNMFTTWADDLKMQKMVYGKIIDKYPENLLTHHQIMAAKAAVLEEKIDQEKWEIAVKEMSKFEYQDSEMTLISPKTRQDMIEEAQMQSNCLASYVRNVTEGSCMIFFLRKKADPDKSYVTIELRNDLSLGQVKAKFNKRPDYKAELFVEKWYTKCVAPNREKAAV